MKILWRRNMFSTLQIEPISSCQGPQMFRLEFLCILRLGYSSDARTLSEFSWRVAANNGWWFFVFLGGDIFCFAVQTSFPCYLLHFGTKISQINSKFAWYLEHFSFRQFSHGHVWMVFIDFLMDSSDFSMVSEIRSCFLSSPLNRITTRTDMQWCRFSVVLKVYAMHNIHLLNL